MGGFNIPFLKIFKRGSIEAISIVKVYGGKFLGQFFNQLLAVVPLLLQISQLLFQLPYPFAIGRQLFYFFFYLIDLLVIILQRDVVVAGGVLIAGAFGAEHNYQ